MAKNFYFAWVDPGTAFNPAVHNVEDEDVFSHTFSHVEGDFAALSVVIRNPRIGLLNPGRKLWAYYSFNQADEGDPPDIVPLFYGRLLGIPDNVFSALVTLNFVARPSDFVEQKQTLASGLRVLPYWDPIFIQPDMWDDPDTVLEARSLLWHIDPVTHVVSTTDYLTPEDGTVDLPASDMFYDTMQLTLQEVPLTSVAVQAIIPWTQTASGTVDLTERIKNIFPLDTEGPETRQLLGSFTMDGFISDWPKTGSRLGNGWNVIDGSLVDVSFLAVKQMTIPVIFQSQGDLPALSEGSILFPVKHSGTIWGGTDGAGYNQDFEAVAVAKGWATPTLVLSYSAKREYAQIVNFVIHSNLQNVATDSGEDEAMLLKVTANKVSDPTFDASIPIEDVRKRDYIHSPRGVQSVEYLILMARAHLIARARVVQITFQTDFVTGLQYTLKKAGIVHDERLPGGEAVGKVVSVTHSLDGDTGEPTCEVVIGCAVGYGGSYTVEAGEPNWFDEGYIDREYQEYINEVAVSDTSDIQYTMGPVTYDDDGTDFVAGLNSNNSVLQLSVVNPPSEQRVAIMDASAAELTDQAMIASVLQTVPTQITLQLIPMDGGPFVSNHTVLTSELVIPKQIDLEAPSV